MHQIDAAKELRPIAVFARETPFSAAQYRWAMTQVRRAVWEMSSSSDIEQVFKAMMNGLIELGIPFNEIGVNLIDDTSKTPRFVTFNQAFKDKGYKPRPALSSADGEKVVLQLWRAQTVSYRRDLLAQDLYSEWAWMEPVRCIVDVPFEMGTLAVNNLEPDAFSRRHLDILWEMAQLVNGGFRRIEDLAALEKRNQVLEEEIARHRQTGQALRTSEKRLALHQQQLRRLAAQLARSEAQERRRLAEDLHDRISQTLALTQMRLDLLAQAPEMAERAAAIDGISALIAQMDEDIRSMTFELSPPVLYELGLEPALEWLAEKAQDEYGFNVEIEAQGPVQTLDEELRTLIFRALRELLHNVGKHAQAQQVHIALLRDKNEWTVVITDDGQGFRPEEKSTRPNSMGGSGLFHIRERLDFIGGRFTIESEPGRGTRCCLVAPLEASEPMGQVELT
ncbi:MAG: hypothetical protein GKR89_15280 [Candidatus Latescibacteria bacterium]|nr:hypothetical protein [Candidatus Latescibacterota bacterium]